MRAFLAAAVWMVMLSSNASASMTYYKYANVDGLKIFYREAGDPKQPTILLLHGFPTSSHMFRDLIPLLSDRFHVLAPDYPGMGYSDAPPVDKFIATFDSVADVTEKLLQQLGQTRVVIYMQDFGGPVGMRLAVRHPDWIEGLIFQNTPISFDGWNPDRLKAAQALAAPVAPEKRAEAEGRVTVERAMFLYQEGARNPTALNPDAWVNDAYAIGKSENKRIMADLILDIPSSFRRYPEWQEYLRSRQPRTLVVWGRRDPVFEPAGAEAIRRAVPTADVIYYDTGHFALEEDGAPIAREITRVFAK
jgi:pimeloyl-ACP methyl ester carboxylesterase